MAGQCPRAGEHHRAADDRLAWPTIDVDDLPRVLRADLTLTLEEVERRHTLRVLESVKGNRAAAASRLGVDPVTLNRKLKRWEQANFSQARHEGEQAGGENLKEQVTRLREEIRRQADRQHDLRKNVDP